MNGRIASLLQDRISGFSYVDKIAGLVRALTKQREGKDITIPVGVGVIDDLQCDESTQRDMIPDNAYRCMVYFEDRGLRKIVQRTRGVSFESRLRLVCWINVEKLNGDVAAADKIMQQFIGSLTSNLYNDGPFIGVRHQVEAIPERGKTLFSAYTYPEGVRQYLMLPYDAFAIDIVTALRIRPGCEDEVVENDVACWTPPTTKRRKNPSEFSCEELQDPVTGLTAEQLGPACLDCSGSGPCDTCAEIALMGGDEVIACIPDGNITVAGNAVLARDPETPDVIAEQITNAGKLAGVQAIICGSPPSVIDHYFAIAIGHP